MTSARQSISHARVWGLALPIMIANVTQPLLGAVDTAVVGHLPQAYHLGAVSIGAMIFSFVYWGFGFLKMGTTGLTAQAWGARDGAEIRAALARSVLLAVLIGCVLVLLQWPIAWLAFGIVEAGPQVEAQGEVYFSIRIWGAPAALVNYVLLGWFVGVQNTRAALAVQLVLNGLNIVLDLIFVMGLDMGVAGVAWATLIAEYVALAIAGFLVLRKIRKAPGVWDRARIMATDKIKRALLLNANIFVRSFCVILAFSLFTMEGAKLGDTILAANLVVQNLTLFMAHALDGFAHGAEALVGSAYGARNRVVLRHAVKLNALWSLIFAGIFTGVYFLFGASIIRILTNIPEVLAVADQLLIWATLAPLIAVWCFLFDGIFVGATRGPDMRNMMLIAFGIYLVALYSLPNWFGNDGLWAAILIFFAARGLTLACRYPALERAVEV